MRVRQRAVMRLLQETGITIPRTMPPQRAEVEALSRARMNQWQQTFGFEPASFEAEFIPSLNIAVLAYGHTPIDVQVQITLFTTLLIIIDDYRLGKEAMEAFPTRLYAGTRQLHPVFDCLVENLADMTKYYLPHASHVIYTSTIEFVEADLYIFYVI